MKKSSPRAALFVCSENANVLLGSAFFVSFLLRKQLQVRLGVAIFIARLGSVLLDEYVAVTGFECKYATKVLGGSRRRETKSKRGAPPKYGSETIDALKSCWFAMEQPCGKRMSDMLPLWIDSYEGLNDELRAQLVTISAASIDRLLKPYKTGNTARIRPLRTSNSIKEKVEIRAESWDVSEPGWTEVDTVAHCGGNMEGNFIWSLTSVDISSGWTEIRAVWNRGQHATCQGLAAIEKAQPFELKGIDSDNGGEFLNHHLYGWLAERGIKQTRSRAYHKNDQAHVEQKNYTHVRQLLGYNRLGYYELLAPLNELLEIWSLWRNLYCVTMEQTSKRREGSRQIRTHAKVSRTPAQRLLDGPLLSEKQRQWIIEQRSVHNPFKLKKRIESLLKIVWDLVDSLNNDLHPEDALAVVGVPPLRSGTPTTAKNTRAKQPQSRVAPVS